MTKRPKSRKYRNLYRRDGGVIYYERVVSGRRIRLSCETTDWDEAASVRDLYEQKKQLGKGGIAHTEPPTFAEFARRYLAEDTDHLAPTTRRERAREVGEDGPLVSFFGALRLDAITKSRIREWWTQEVQGRGRKTKTGRNYLDALAGVLGYAVELEILDSNPVDEFRVVLRRKGRTQRGRAESDPSRHIRPIEDPEQIDRLVREASIEGPEALVLILLCLDTGLRLGEALGLRWRSIAWGEYEDDPRRSLLIDESRPRGGAPGHTKSGRARTVALSRRLRRALEKLRRAKWGPRPEEHVLPYGDPSVFRRLEWRRILGRARRTFAS